MDKNSKRKVAGGAVYVFCAFMLVSILSIAMLTAISDSKSDTNTPAGSPVEDVDSTTVTTGGGSRKGGQSKTPEVDSNTNKPIPDSGSFIINGTEPADRTDAVPYAYEIPVDGEVSKVFNNKLAVWSTTMNDYRVHLGVDFEAPQGEAVSAFADGKISAVWNDPFMGHCVCVEHTGGMKSYYMNLSGDYPSGIGPGAEVTAGQTIGAVGGSAKIEASDPTHLHFEVTVNGEHVDPLDYLEVPTAVRYEDED